MLLRLQFVSGSVEVLTSGYVVRIRHVRKEVLLLYWLIAVAAC